MRRARSVAALGGVLLALLVLVATAPPAVAGSFRLPPVRHVFVIVLENQAYPASFGDRAADPYLAGTLAAKGALLTNYYATGHFSNDNYISLISGQPPNPANQADCPRFANFEGAALLADGVEAGTGCVYPADVANIGTQLSAKGLTWKGYMEDMGNVATREAAACGHPALGAPDATEAAVRGDGYATRHDPFVYFHSVIDRAAYCDRHVVALGSPSGSMPPSALRQERGLATDLRSVATTPNFSLIIPNLCADGHDYPCKNQASGRSAAADIDRFLKTWVPKILASPAYKQGGMLEITFDEADGSNDASACCHEKAGPAAPHPGISGPGGGRVGAVVLSPFIHPKTMSHVHYNHYSSLATWERLFGLSPLAYARGAKTFGPDVFTAAHR